MTQGRGRGRPRRIEGDALAGRWPVAGSTVGWASAPERTAPRRLRATVGAWLVVLAAFGCSSNPRPPMGAADAELEGNDAPAFAVGVTPTMAPPVAVGTAVGFRLSSSRDGYAHLYLLGSDGGATALAENLPVAAGAQADWPPPGGDVTIRASAPVGVDRLILLVTQQPFVGFAGAAGQGLARPVGLAETAEAFLERFNETTAGLPASSWAVAETRVQVVE